MFHNLFALVELVAVVNNNRRE
jgi:hypothetical protein